jgi:hypothetical protein
VTAESIQIGEQLIMLDTPARRPGAGGAGVLTYADAGQAAGRWNNAMGRWT